MYIIIMNLSTKIVDWLENKFNWTNPLQSAFSLDKNISLLMMIVMGNFQPLTWLLRKFPKERKKFSRKNIGDIWEGVTILVFGDKS